MTRCYEAYCYFKNNPYPCKSERTIQRINQYIRFMEQKGVKFNKQSDDKKLFQQMVKKYGVERKVTQPIMLRAGGVGLVPLEFIDYFKKNYPEYRV